MKRFASICLLLVACASPGRDAEVNVLTDRGELARSEPTRDDGLSASGMLDEVERTCSARSTLPAPVRRTASRKRPPQPERCTDSPVAE